MKHINNKIIATILLAVSLMLVLAFVGSQKNNNVRSQQPSVSPIPTTTASVPVVAEKQLERKLVQGKIVCIPLKNTQEENAECITGISIEGEIYVLDTNVLQSQAPSYEVGDSVSANGIATPIEFLSTDKWQKYNIQGIFSVTDSFIVSDKNASKGTISGRLCYPSSFLPAGSIEAKNVNTAELITMEYPGSDKGGKSTYGMQVPEGTYVVRYLIGKGPNAGYHTSCTGVEASCQDQETKRESIPVEVKANATTSDVALCDFYYPQDKVPNF